MLKKILNTLKSIKFWTIVGAIATCLGLLYSILTNQENNKLAKAKPVELAAFNYLDEETYTISLKRIDDDVDTIYILTELQITKDQYMDSVWLYSVPIPFALLRTDNIYKDNIIFDIHANPTRFFINSNLHGELNRFFHNENKNSLLQRHINDKVKLQNKYLMFKDSLAVINGNLVTDGLVDSIDYTIQIIQDGYKDRIYHVCNYFFMSKERSLTRTTPSYRYFIQNFYGIKMKGKFICINKYYPYDNNNIVRTDDQALRYSSYNSDCALKFNDINNSIMAKSYIDLTIIALLLILLFIIGSALKRVYSIKNDSFSDLNLTEIAWLTGDRRRIIILFLFVILLLFFLVKSYYFTISIYDAEVADLLIHY